VILYESNAHSRRSVCSTPCRWVPVSVQEVFDSGDLCEKGMHADCACWGPALPHLCLFTSRACSPPSTGLDVTLPLHA
jgi:hypothetical protein